MRGGAANATALIDAPSGRRVTYAELDALVSDAAQRLRHEAGESGIAFLFCSNDIDTVVEYLGALDAGVPVALFDQHLDAGFVRGLVDRYRPEVIRSLPLERAQGGAAPHPELALLLSTSGSTGSPKLVRLTRDAVAANARSIAQALAIGPQEIAPTSLPIHYSYGLSILNSHLVAGATVVLTDDSLLSDGFWRACRTHGATSLAGVPYSYEMLRRIDLDRVAPPTLLTLTQAGGRLDPTLVRRFHETAARRGGRMFVMYGQTEATARITVLPPSELPARAGAVGLAVPGGEVRILVEGRAAAPGEDGAVVYRGPNVMLGYAERREDLGRGDELAGELETGDIGHLDEGGHLWITGRQRRMTKVFGMRVNLDDVEGILRARPHTPAVAAVGGADIVRVFVETSDGQLTTALRQTLAERTGIHHSGFAVAAVDALPRLPSGKIDYAALEAS